MKMKSSIMNQRRNSCAIFAEGAIVRELTFLSWKNIRLEQLEHRAVLQALSKISISYGFGYLFLMQPESELVFSSLELLTYQYLQDC